MNKRFTDLLLALILVFSLFSAGAMAMENADDRLSIIFELVEKDSPALRINVGETIYMGETPWGSDGASYTPWEWLVLNNLAGSTGETNQLFMLSKYTSNKETPLLAEGNNYAYKEEEIDTPLDAWQGSYTYGMLHHTYENELGIYGKAYGKFDVREKDAVIRTELKTEIDYTDTKHPDVTLESEITYNYLFAPSIAEIQAFPSDIVISGPENASPAAYWLRDVCGARLYENTADLYDKYVTVYAAYVDKDGNVSEPEYDENSGRFSNGKGASDTAYIRPAFNLNGEQVLMVSASEESGNGATLTGKGDSLGKFTEMGQNDNNTEWKLTLRDTQANSTRDRFDAALLNDTVVQGTELKIKYSGATQGTNEYISAMLVPYDVTNAPWYYAQVTKVPDREPDASGDYTVSDTASITIDENIPVGDYTLFVFNEQRNGSYRTDYSSEFVKLTLTVTDELVALPQTGDDAQIGMWIGFMMIAVAGLVVCAAPWRRKRVG